MDVQTPAKQPVQPAPVIVPYSPPVEPEPRSGFSALFIIFAVLVIGGAGIAGAIQSGKISVNGLFKAAKTAAPSIAAALPSFHMAPVMPPKPGTFTVTSISLGQPSYAIINGQSRTVGDPAPAPGVFGWKVGRIEDGRVWLQNGATWFAVPLTEPGLKPLDDTLNPVN
ncbi:MAG: hypothetical protein ABSE62_02880 [Chthoniobacteraceae bacterium]|jgi:hypothetical protein